MCGLAALFAHHPDAPPVDGAELRAINAAMAARGPDGDGHWVADDGRVGLAHRRLAIIDLSDAAAQPMVLRPGGPGGGDGPEYRITYNGEIYNFRALRDELIAAGAPVTTQSDTEVLLHLYHRHGPDMVHRLRGMFALAIWDGPRRGLFLARDSFGIKPLYYADDGRTLRVASQVKALRAGGVAGTGVDPAGHVGFFLMGSVPDPHTLYADIRALPAGCTLWADGGGVGAPVRYDDIPARLRAAGAAGVDLRDALLDSVRHHFVADVEVGVFLSAGLDSATITGLASEIRGADLRTLTVAFDEFAGRDLDEAPLARRVADLYGTNHTEVRVPADWFDDQRDAVLAAMDQPTIDGINVYLVAQAAARAGLKVALSGTGGDELFAGYNVFRRVPLLYRALRWINAPPPLGWAGALAAHLGARLRPTPKVRSLARLAPTVRNAYIIARGLYMPWELDTVLDPDLVRAGTAALRLFDDADTADEASADTSRARVTGFEVGLYLCNQLLRDSDWAGMAHSLEIRVPLVDLALYDRVLAGLTSGHPPGKADMAATPATPLPGSVLNRPKTGFAVPFRSWMPDGQATSDYDRRGWARTVYAAFTA
ncbi:MAG: asparagine synthase (glutamine-hydrolyzing) [Hyphomicrobiales bacterium]|nr:asparagine synthase (glutamine-hydrolyzing) [Hyphomicrobiales bacterium]MCP5370122.1 asparagine synthase (glutamine-hydrolyzing) [Hyphomicrobiales bacterium]